MSRAHYRSAFWCLSMLAMAGCGGQAARQPSAPAADADVAAAPQRHAVQRADNAAAPVKPAAPAAPEEPPKPIKPLAMPSPEQQEVDPVHVQHVQTQLELLGRRALPAERDRPVSRDSKARYHQWVHELVVGGYKEFGPQDPKCDESAIAFLEEYLRQRTAEESQKDARKLAGLARQALLDQYRTRHRDPLLELIDAQMRFGYGPEQDLGESFRHARNAVEGFKTSRYPALLPFQANMMLWRQTDDPVAARRLAWEAARLAVEAMSAPIERGTEGNVYWRIYTYVDGANAAVKGDFIGALVETPHEKANPWVYSKLLADEHSRLGWLARGSGYANTVSREGWEEYGPRLAAARALQVKCWHERPEVAEAAISMINLCKSVGPVAGEDPRFWFDEAVHYEFDNEAAYSNLITALQPRWGGSHEAMLEFGRECLATGRFETRVPWQYHHVLLKIADDFKDRSEAYRLPGVYEDYQRLIEGNLALERNEDRRRYFQSALACAAWLCGRQEEAGSIVQRLDGRVDERGFLDFKMRYGDLKKQLFPVQPGERSKAQVAFAAKEGEVSEVAFSRDGKVLFTGGRDGLLRRWDVESGKALEPWKAHEWGLSALEISPDGKWLATGGAEDGVRLWDLDKPGASESLPMTGAVSALAFSRDSQKLAAASGQEAGDGQIKLWDVAAAKLLVETSLSGQYSSSMCFSADHQTLVTALAPVQRDVLTSQGTVAFWNTGDLSLSKSLRPFDGGVWCVAQSEDGKTLAVGGNSRTRQNGNLRHDYMILLFDVGADVPRLTLRGHVSPIRRLKFLHNDQTLVSAGNDWVARFWDIANGQTRALLAGHAAPLYGLAANQEQTRLATSDLQGTLRVWPVSSALLRSQEQGDIAKHAFYTQIRGLEFLSDGSLVVTTKYRGASIWPKSNDYHSGELHLVDDGTTCHDSSVSADLKTVAITLSNYANTESRVVRIDRESGQRLPALTGLPLPWAVRYSPDGRTLATGDASGVVLLRDAASGEPWQWGRLSGHGRAIHSLLFSADNQRLATVGQDGTVKLWRLPADPTSPTDPLKAERTLKVGQLIASARFSLDSKLLLIGNKNADMYEVESGVKRFSVSGQEVAFSPDGTLFATGGGTLNTEAAIWETATGQEKRRLQGPHRQMISCLVFSPDGQRLLTGDDGGKLCCWDTQSGDEVPDFSGL